MLDLYEHPGHLLRRAQQISTALFYDEIGSDLTPVQYAMLNTLAAHPGIDQVSLSGLVAIDTSLSMTEAELAEVARQLGPLSELAQLHVVECDRSIARDYPFLGTLEQVKGRGGTDLRPVFEPAFLCARGADGVVYFTDGDGPYPEHAPPLPVLWMLTKPRSFACPWGARAALRLAASERTRR